MDGNISQSLSADYQMAVARQSIIQAQQHAHLQAAQTHVQQHQHAHVQHHQVQQAQQARQQQMAAAVAQHRNSSFFAPSFNQQAEQTQMAMVTTAKLAVPKKNKASSSILAVRSTVPRYNVSGGIYSVAQWARKCVEDNLEFIVKLVRRHDPKAQLVMLAYGDGCQTLVLLDDAMNIMPVDIFKVKKIDIGVSAAPIDDKTDENKMAASSGILTPSDSLWDHLRYEQANVSKDKQEHIMFLHTTMTVYGGGTDGRRRVLQIKTEAPNSPYVAIRYVSNPAFEQQVLVKWTGTPVQQVETTGIASLPAGTMSTAAAAAYVAATTPDEEEEDDDDGDEFVITFNPKEILLLEKAYDGKLTTRDMKSKADKWEEKDQFKCQATIKRLQNEFTYVDPSKQEPYKNSQIDNKKKAVEETAKKPIMKKDKPTEPKTPAPKKVSPDDKKKEMGKSTTTESSKKEKRSSISKERAITGSTNKTKRTSISKGKEQTAKKSTENLEKKASPVDSDDKVITTVKTPTTKKGKSKVGTEKANTPSKPKSAAKKSTAEKKQKCVTIKSNIPEKKNEESSNKRDRDQSKDTGTSPKKTRFRTKARAKK